MGTAKKQTGLTINRKNLTFTCEWKKGETYTQQWFEWKKNSLSWNASSISKTETKKAITIASSDWYPNKSSKLTKFSFRVRADAQNDNKSDWVSKSMTLSPPDTPTLTLVHDDTYRNVTHVTWSSKEGNTQPLTDIEYQTVLTEGNEQPDWNVASVSKSKSGSLDITETNAAVQNGSHRRWVRIRARGCAGHSGWVTRARAFAQPKEAENVEADANVQSGGIQVSVSWSQFTDFAYPVSESEVQYLIGVPRSGMLPPASGWETLSQIKKDSTGASGFIDSGLQNDECLWVRVVSKHHEDATASKAIIVLYGELADPELTTVQKNDQTFRATITASNRSSVPGSFLVVQYRTKSAPGDVMTVGIIPSGSTSTTVQCPDWSGETAVEFGVYAAVGTYQQTTRGGSVSSYEVSAVMQSAGTVWEGGSVPQAPSNLTISRTSVDGTVRLVWDWDWEEANGAQITWADHEDAWESTDEPEEYVLSNLQTGAWNVAGLEMGRRWYFRVRLLSGTGENAVAGSWSNMAMIDLSAAPSVPVLNLSQRYVTVKGSVAAYWTYVSGDGSDQTFAEICEATISGGGITYGQVIATATTEQNLTLYAEDLGWNSGETHNLCVRVVSGSGQASPRWSDPVSVVVAQPISMSISQSSLVLDNDEYFLTEMPLTVTVTGAGYGGVTSLVIARASAYFLAQPDERPFNGYEDETIAIYSQTGDSQISIGVEDLIGQLNDGASYVLIATVEDEYGQTAELRRDFRVAWTHKAVKPWGHAYFAGTAAVIQCAMPTTGYAAGDVCDIYRLSADRPELIYQGLTPGEKIVDPYPTIGEFGGYRIVYRTFNNDFITTDDEIGWFDIPMGLDVIYSLIDFPDGQIRFLYDVNMSSKWEKDFKKTKYLGGSVTGDWNKAIDRTASLEGAVVTSVDQESIQLFRRLADYAGSCHLRTVDGSSFTCDIQVTEGRHFDKETIRGTYTLSVSHIDPEELDGIKYEYWISNGGE